MKMDKKISWTIVFVLIVLFVLGSFTFGYFKDREIDKEGLFSLFRMETIKSNQEISDELIEKNYFSQKKYDDFIKELTFEETIHNFNQDSFLNMLLDRGFIKPDITTKEELKSRVNAKGFNIEELQLRPYGIISAINDFIAEGSLFNKQRFSPEDDWTDNLMMSYKVLEQLKTDFYQDKIGFIDYMDEEGFLEILGSELGVTPTIEPIRAYTFSNMDYEAELGRELNEYLINPIIISYSAPFVRFYPDDETAEEKGNPYLTRLPETNLNIYYDTGSWTTDISETAKRLNSMPEGQRMIQISGVERKDLFHPGYKWWGSLIDSLKNEDGDIVFWDAGENNPSGHMTYYFPSQDEWVEILQNRLEPFFAELSNEIESDRINYVMMDYEGIRTNYVSVMKAFENNFLEDNGEPTYADFLKDERSILMLSKMDIDPDIILGFDNIKDPLKKKKYYYGSEIQLKWDKYILQKRAEDIYNAYLLVVHEYFPNAVASNWRNKLSSELVQSGRFDLSQTLWGLGNPLMKSSPNTVFYGVQKQDKLADMTIIESSPPAPRNHWRIDENNHMTRFNALISGIKEANTVSSATSLRTQHYVSNPLLVDSFYAGLYGSDVSFNFDTEEYENAKPDSFETGIGDVMAEFWYRAGVEAETLFYYDFKAGETEYLSQVAEFAERTLVELNEVLGYSDREFLYDGWVEINGDKVPVSVDTLVYPKENEEGVLIWGARANNKNVYRIIFDIDLKAGESRDSFLINDGRDGSYVKFIVGDKTIEFPNAEIYTPSEEVSLQGFWVVQKHWAGKVIKGTVECENGCGCLKGECLGIEEKIISSWGPHINRLSDEEFDEFVYMAEELKKVGFTHIGIHIDPQEMPLSEEIENRINRLRGIQPLALHSSSVHYFLNIRNYEGVNHENGYDLKFFSASSDIWDPYNCDSGCERGLGDNCIARHHSLALDPAYNGRVWQDELDRLDVLMDNINIQENDIVLFDSEIWRDTSLRFEQCYPGVLEAVNDERYFGSMDDKRQQYSDYVRQRGNELVERVKVRNSDIKAMFYYTNPEGRWGYFPYGVGDAPNPSLYYLPNLNSFETVLNMADYSEGGYAWPSFSWYTGLRENMKWDPLITQKAGYLLKQAGINGIIEYPGPHATANKEGFDFNYYLEQYNAFAEGFIDEINPGELIEICDDEVDNDGDRYADCEDSYCIDNCYCEGDCVCGDGKCDSDKGEDCSTCSEDCGDCASVGGNGGGSSGGGGGRDKGGHGSKNFEILGGNTSDKTIGFKGSIDLENLIDTEQPESQDSTKERTEQVMASALYFLGAIVTGLIVLIGFLILKRLGRIRVLKKGIKGL